MSERTTYSYSVLRYMHDVASGEFVNLGVVLYSPGSQFFKACMRRSVSRITRFFPDAKGRALLRTLRNLENSLNRRGADLREIDSGNLFEESISDVLDLARKNLPSDDSSLQWSSVSGGLTAEPAKTLDHLFHRLVTMYDEATKRETRSDDQVWRNFSKALEIRNLTADLKEHEIHATVDSICFDHALKNGKWHVLEPISFDLVDGMSIKKKAQQIVGEMAVLKDATEDFDVYFLVGQPSSQSVMREYDIAIKTLEIIPSMINAHIYTEDQVDAFAQRLVTVMADHHE